MKFVFSDALERGVAVIEGSLDENLSIGKQFYRVMGNPLKTVDSTA